MRIKGKRSITVSQLEGYELLVIAAALNDYYKLEMAGCADGGITPQGETALRLLNQINEYRGG
jgi:hypothetical protein